jgi:hypothetical protein
VAKKLNVKVLGFNVVAGFVILTAVTTSIRNSLFPPTATPCSERMAQSVTLGLSHNGRILQAPDFQAIAGGMDFGVLENLAVVPVRNAPAPVVMEVLLKAGTAQQNMPNVDAGGMSMPWSPRSLQPNLEHGCLVYSVFLPDTFQFGDGGTLPGLKGASRSIGAMNEERFTTAFVWGEQGVSRVFASGGNNDAMTSVLSDFSNVVALPKGRWVRIEQEVKLNDIGARNGLLRLWVDGAFVSARKDAMYRLSKDNFISGVNLNVFFGGQGETKGRGKALQNERIMITPVEIRWN